MLSPVRLLPLIGSLLSVVSGLPTASPSSVVLPPSVDPFYSAPHGYESTAPGAILRLRPAPGNLTALVGNASAAYNIVYRTTDSQYRPSWAVTTVFVPSNPRPGNTSLLSYQIAYDSHSINASPSYAMYTSPPVDISLALSQLVRQCPGLRGIINSNTTAFNIKASSSRTALWGYSGGALASEWAAELQVQYAPELSLAGAALGGLTPNITNVMNTVTGNINAGLIPEAVLGKHNRTTFLLSRNMTLAQAEAFFAGQNVYDYFVNGSDTFKAPVVQYALNRDGYMGYHGVPQIPIYAYKAIHDEVSPVGDTDALLERYCGVGVNILYERNAIGGHSAEGINGHARALQFVAAVLDGSYASAYQTMGCTFRDVAVNITDSAL
ncbi:lipase 1 precursor [Aspergillus bombycis]|uniref:Lipase 1 n=1 Tax=Aspergillus bombycis TaxID=109264 RepID=A0A1F8AAS5_9EURO|nr:lipase 1 precursor [Aspergillus bombycis]OGM48448.1 lipase 1 precursor [Aspergillus bombycis]